MTGNWRQDRQAFWRGISSNMGVAPDDCGEEGAELQGKTLNLSVDLHSNPHLWP